MKRASSRLLKKNQVHGKRREILRANNINYGSVDSMEDNGQSALRAACQRIYTGGKAVAKRYAGILPIAADAGKHEISQRN